MMTKYDLQEIKQEERRVKRAEKKAKRLARRTARRKKRREHRFLRQSNAKYRWYHRIIIKTLRVFGPLGAFGYVAYNIYKSFFLNIHDIDPTVGVLNIKNLSLLLIFGSILLVFALYFGFKYLRTAIAANAVARNQGTPSMSYSPVVITAIRAVLSSWFFGLLYLFSYIATNYGDSLAIGFKTAFIAYCVGFGLILAGDIVEQSILHRVRNAKHKAEDETREMVLNLSNDLEARQAAEVE